MSKALFYLEVYEVERKDKNNFIITKEMDNKNKLYEFLIDDFQFNLNVEELRTLENMLKKENIIKDNTDIIGVNRKDLGSIQDNGIITIYEINVKDKTLYYLFNWNFIKEKIDEFPVEIEFQDIDYDSL